MKIKVTKDAAKTFTFPKKIGIGIKVRLNETTGKFDLHIGFLYFDMMSGKPYFCHQTNEKDRNKNEPIRENYSWVSTSFNEAESTSIITTCAVLCNKSVSIGGIPYGFTFRPNLINSGEWQGGGVEGVTCATFVLAILESLGFSILETDYWFDRSEADKEAEKAWKEYILELFSKDVGPISIARIRKSDTSPRFKPEEVTVGCASTDRPIDYNVASNRAEQLRNDLEIDDTLFDF